MLVVGHKVTTTDFEFEDTTSSSTLVVFFNQFLTLLFIHLHVFLLCF